MLGEFLDNLLKERTTGMLCYGGSKIYGLATEDSDVDYRGFYYNTTEELLGLQSPKEQYTDITDKVDVNMQSLHKFCLCALKNNFETLEVLFMPEHFAFHMDHNAQYLRAHVKEIVSDKALRSYGGYVYHNYNNRAKMMNDPKLLSHWFRLCLMGTELFQTGVLENMFNQEFLVNSLMSIKQGYYSNSLEQLEHDMLHELQKFKYAEKHHVLQPVANSEKFLNDFIIRVYQDRMVIL